MDNSQNVPVPSPPSTPVEAVRSPSVLTHVIDWLIALVVGALCFFISGSEETWGGIGLFLGFLGVEAVRRVREHETEG